MLSFQCVKHHTDLSEAVCVPVGVLLYYRYFQHVAHILKINVRVVALEEKTTFLLQITETKGLLRLKLQAVSSISCPGCVYCSDDLWIDIPSCGWLYSNFFGVSS